MKNNLLSPDIELWKESMKDYEHKRKNLSFEPPQATRYRTHKDIKSKDVEYHPILQTYADPQRVKRATNENIISSNQPIPIKFTSASCQPLRHEVPLAFVLPTRQALDLKLS